MVFSGLYPIDGDEVPGAARGAGEAATERLELHLRPRDLRGARLRVPVRLPRPVAHGDRPRAPRARVRPVADHHGAVGRVPSAAHRNDEIIEVDNPSEMPNAAEIAAIEEPYLLATILTPANFGGGR